MQEIDFITIFTVAFLGSVGHCIGMCGGFILAYSGAKIGENWSKTHQSVAHILYNIGRVASYILIGAVFGFIGSAFIISWTVWGSLLLVIGFIMILMGFSFMGKLKFLSKIEANISQNRLYGTLYRSLISSKSLPSFFALGMLNGLIPCGLVYIFAAFALASGSVLMGMLIMAVFGLATIPALFSFGFLSTLIQKSRFRKIALTIASILVIAYGAFTFLKGTVMIVKPEMINAKFQMMKKHDLERLNAKKDK